MCLVLFQVSNMFIMSLAAADITVGSIVMPISSVYAITGKKRYRWIYQTNNFYIYYFGNRWYNQSFQRMLSI